MSIIEIHPDCFQKKSEGLKTCDREGYSYFVSSVSKQRLVKMLVLIQHMQELDRSIVETYSWKKRNQRGFGRKTSSHVNECCMFTT